MKLGLSAANHPMAQGRRLQDSSMENFSNHVHHDPTLKIFHFDTFNFHVFIRSRAGYEKAFNRTRLRQTDGWLNGSIRNHYSVRVREVSWRTHNFSCYTILTLSIAK